MLLSPGIRIKDAEIEKCFGDKKFLSKDNVGPSPSSIKCPFIMILSLGTIANQREGTRRTVSLPPNKKCPQKIFQKKIVFSLVQSFRASKFATVLFRSDEEVTKSQLFSWRPFFKDLSNLWHPITALSLSYINFLICVLYLLPFTCTLIYFDALWYIFCGLDTFQLLWKTFLYLCILLYFFLL